jgi:hypothetical protein
MIKKLITVSRQIEGLEKFTTFIYFGGMFEEVTTLNKLPFSNQFPKNL